MIPQDIGITTDRYCIITDLDTYFDLSLEEANKIIQRLDEQEQRTTVLLTRVVGGFRKYMKKEIIE